MSKFERVIDISQFLHKCTGDATIMIDVFDGSIIISNANCCMALKFANSVDKFRWNSSKFANSNKFHRILLKFVRISTLFQGLHLLHIFMRMRKYIPENYFHFEVLCITFTSRFQDFA